MSLWEKLERDYLADVEKTAEEFGKQMANAYRDHMHHLWFGAPDGNDFPGLQFVVKQIKEKGE